MSIYYSNELYHFGILGQKWGERRYQNEDGSLTEEGRQHYGYGEKKAAVVGARYAVKQANKKYSKAYSKAANSSGIHLTKKGQQNSDNKWKLAKVAAENAHNADVKYREAKNEFRKSNEYTNEERVKDILRTGAEIAGTALLAYGTIKLIGGSVKSYSAATNLGQQAVTSLLRGDTFIGSIAAGGSLGNLAVGSALAGLAGLALGKAVNVGIEGAQDAKDIYKNEKEKRTNSK